jgi:peptidylprolyl isomerase
MKKQPSQDRRQAVEAPKKLLIGIASGVVVIAAIAAIIYFAWPKPPPVTELIVEDLVVGTGREATEGDTLTVEYTGWLQTKSKAEPFDSSYDKQRPFDFVLGDQNIIAGWNRGIAGMKVDGKRRLTVPADLAYGAEGAGNGIIPPNAVLVFEVELLNVAGPPPAALPPTSITDLIVEDLVVGTGATANPGDVISVHYTGWLEDGTKFDSSYDSGGPIEFVLGQGEVIDGWDFGLVSMKVGGKRRLTVPPDLAYGAKGMGDFIPPNAALIFEVELLEIK